MSRLLPHPWLSLALASSWCMLNASLHPAHLLLTRSNPGRVEKGEMLSIADVEDILGLKVIGVIPESLEPHIGLTPTVEAMIEPALEQVLAALRESGVEAIPREATHD